MRGRRTYPPGTPADERNDYWGVVLDAPDAGALADFYEGLLGWRAVRRDPHFVTLHPGEGVAYLAVQTNRSYVRPVWPGAPGEQQMMLHLDVEVSDLQDAVEHAVELGGTLAEFQPQEDVRVVLDPAGHPFCLYADG